jgi:hypothetical protein
MRLIAWLRRVFHRCGRDTFMRHLSEQSNLYACDVCGLLLAHNHAIGVTLPFTADISAFYESQPDCYPPCECATCKWRRGNAKWDERTQTQGESR